MSESSRSNQMDRPGVILAGVLISALGAMTYNLLPLFLGTAQDFRGLSDQSIGVLGSGFFAGFTLTTITAFFWVRRFNWRLASFSAIPVAGVALVVAGLTESYLLMVIAVVVAGAAFSVLYGIGTTVLSDTSQPTRWYGLKIASEAGLGMILLLFLPSMVIQRWGFSGLLAAMALVLILLAPLLAWLPPRGIKGREPAVEKYKSVLVPTLKLALWLALAAVMTYMFCMTMIWAFVERVAHDAGFEAVATDNVLSLSLVLAVCGSLTAMMLADRFGLVLPLAVAVLLLLISLVLLDGMDTLPIYALAICLFNFSFGLGIPYMVTVVAKLDIDGRFVVLSVPAMGVGVMFAPALGGLLSVYGDHTAPLKVGAVCVLVALLLVIFALRLGLSHARAHRLRPGGAVAETLN